MQVTKTDRSFHGLIATSCESVRATIIRFRADVSSSKRPPYVREFGLAARLYTEANVQSYAAVRSRDGETENVGVRFDDGTPRAFETETSARTRRHGPWRQSLCKCMVEATHEYVGGGGI